MTTGASLPTSLLYSEETLRPYFPANTDAHIGQFTRSIDAANAFLRVHPPVSLARGGHKIKGLARALQYFKDETFLTFYAFVSQMDIAGGLYVRAHGASSSLCGAMAPTTLADDVKATLWQCAWWPCMLSNT